MYMCATKFDLGEEELETFKMATLIHPPRAQARLPPEWYFGGLADLCDIRRLNMNEGLDLLLRERAHIYALS